MGTAEDFQGKNGILEFQLETVYLGAYFCSTGRLLEAAERNRHDMAIVCDVLMSTEVCADGVTFGKRRRSVGEAYLTLYVFGLCQE